MRTWSSIPAGRTRPGRSQWPSPCPAPPTNQALLAFLTRAYLAQGRAYDPAKHIRNPEELDYLRHRSAHLLTASDWNARNMGVKLIGLLKDETKIEHLLRFVEDRTPASRLHRLLGGDFKEVGFIRRNALTSLMVIDKYVPGLDRVLVAALKDPYYEVRVRAAKGRGPFLGKLSRFRPVPGNSFPRTPRPQL